MYRKVEAGGEEEGKDLSERLKRVRAGTKEYTSAAVLKKLAQARHGVSMGTVRPPLTAAPADYDPSPTLQLAEAACI
jgi:4-hydroxy-tetrahydrodipicolinate synthase